MLKAIFVTVTLSFLTTTEAQFGRPIGPGGFGGHRDFGRPGGSGIRPPHPPLPPRPPRPQPPPPPQLQNLILCTTTQLAQDKCLYALEVAANSSIDLKLQCTQADSYDACLRAIRTRAADLVVADEHEYKPAREAGLTPVLYAHELLTSYYIAVAPRNITLLELDEAIIDVNSTDERAFHAAAFFNLQRGHDICRQFMKAAAIIKIRDSAEYLPNDDELLICANRTVAEWDDYSTCNVEASLERAVFAANPIAANSNFKRLVQNVFNTLIQRLGSQNGDWNFFSDFQNTSDVIFKNNTIGFSPIPVYKNDVTEEKFNYLHCNTESQEHDPSQLE